MAQFETFPVSAAKEAAGKSLPQRKVRPQRLKARLKQSVFRSAEALRHPKAGAKSSFSATSKAGIKNRALRLG
jgi:hypothetical protein